MKKCIAVLGLTLFELPMLAKDALKETFETLSLSARPLVWWSWPKGLVDKSVLKRELVALKEQGFGGAQIYDWDVVGSSNIWGSVVFNSQLWKECVAFVVREAETLGLEIGLNHVSGWAATSGPWVTGDEAVKRRMMRWIEITGPREFDGKLPALTRAEFAQRDFRVLACPVPPSELRDRVRFTVTSTLTNDIRRLSQLDRCYWGRWLRLSSTDATKNIFEFSAPKPEVVAAIEYQLTGKGVPRGRPGSCLELSYMDEKGDWCRVLSTDVFFTGDGISMDTCRRHVIRPVKARRFRVVFRPLCQQTSSGIPPTCDLGALRLRSARGIASLSNKTLSVVGGEVDSVTDSDENESEAAVSPDSIIDLTDRMSADGCLRWQVPAGTWRILRCGYIETLRRNLWANPGHRGRLCDIMSEQGVHKHFSHFLEPLVEFVYGKDCRFRSTGLTHTLVDSLECGYQTWSADFADVFERRNGYSIIPFLPVFSGIVVSSSPVSERVLWDYRRTAAELISERYGRTLRNESNRIGLRLYLEGVGDANVDTIDFALCGDVPMSEFWLKNSAHCSIPPNVSAAHLTGNPLVASEAFTAGPENLGWGHDALRLKQAADCALAMGVNRFIYHSYQHNPLPTKYRPGIRLGCWGTQMEPTQTWWEHVGASIVGYQGRASALLQAGRPVVDALVFTGEGAPNAGRIGGANLPDGVRADFINRSLVLKLTVEDGDLVLPSGVRYRMLVFPRGVCRALTPELMEKLVALAKDGARLVLPELPTRSPSFRGYPVCDVRVRELAKDLATHLFARQTPEAFKKAGIVPDVTFEGLDGVRWNHTRYPDGSESFFLARTNGVAACGTASFRTTGTAIELWDAETGDIVSTDSRVADGRTTVDLSFKPTGSVFVMFRPQPTEGAKPQWKGRETAAREVAGPWNVTFPVGWYYNEPDVKSIEMKTLADWTTLDDPDLKYFSGAAMYRTEVELQGGRVAELQGLEKGERVFLDLGEVKNFAVVTVNGTTYPVLWRPPYRVDVTDAVRAAADGKLDLSVRVTNLWPNRLIGDAALPTDCKWNADGTLAKIPDWVKKGEKSPTGRHTFITYNKLISKDMSLLPSGLLGPVRFVKEEKGTDGDKPPAALSYVAHERQALSFREQVSWGLPSGSGTTAE